MARPCFFSGQSEGPVRRFLELGETLLDLRAQFGCALRATVPELGKKCVQRGTIGLIGAEDLVELIHTVVEVRAFFWRHTLPRASRWIQDAECSACAVGRPP